MQAERRERWYDHNALRPGRPLLFVSPEGSWVELVTEESLDCRDDDARGVERALRCRLHAAEHFCDDQVYDAEWRVGRALSFSDWGLNSPLTHSSTPRGAYVWDGAVKTRADLAKMKPPTVTHDAERSRDLLDEYRELFDGILSVVQSGSFGFGFGLIDEWSRLRGITPMFLDMADDPAFVHEALRTLMEGRLALAEQMIAESLVDLNNGNHYVGSGGFGFSRELPQADAGDEVRLADLWGFCDAQILSEVSPAMHEEFVIDRVRPPPAPARRAPGRSSQPRPAGPAPSGG